MPRRTLVLNVDRDNDFGDKAGIESPIIGRRQNLMAAVALGVTDPEDSDTNSIFAAIKLYDELLEIEQDHVEIATICGHTNAGRRADREIVRQLEMVLERTDPDGVYFVTDGAEDEAIMPIVRSRVPVDHIEKVVVRQHKEIEGTFYMFTKALGDPKIQRKVITPFAIAAIVFGICLVLGRWELGIGLIFLIIGIYLMIRVTGLETPLRQAVSDVGISLREGRTLYLLISIFAVIVFAFGVVITFDIYLDVPVPSSDVSYKEWYALAVAVNDSLYIYIFSFFIFLLGKTLDMYIHQGKVSHNLFPSVLGLIAAYFLVYALLLWFHTMMDNTLLRNTKVLYAFIIIGSMAGVAAIIVARYLKERYGAPKKATKAGWRR